MWLQFLQHDTAFTHPVIDCTKLWNADELDIYLDSSANPLLRMGAICQLSWMVQQWEPWLNSGKNTLSYLLWLLGYLNGFRGSEIAGLCFFATMSVLSMVNHSTSGCKNHMVLV